MKLFWSSLFLLLAPFLSRAADITLLLPANGAGFQNSRRAILQWQSDREDLLSYQVYLGLTPDTLEFLGDSGTNMYATTGALEKNRTYYWQITGTNQAGETFPSEVWSFTTADPAIPTYRFISSANPDAYDTELDAMLIVTNRTIELDKTVLLVIDFWRGPECSHGPDCPDPSEHHAQTNLLNLIQLARQHGIPIVHLPHDYPITPAVTPMPWEPVWDFSGLDQYLATNGFSTLLYAGFATAECVTLSRRNSVHPLGRRGAYDILLVKDCTYSPYWHYQWAVKGVESIYASTLLDDLATAMAEPPISVPLEIPELSRPLMPEIDQTLAENLWPEQSALVVINAWADHPNDGWRERISANNTNVIRPLLTFARALKIPVIHVPNGRPLASSCAPAPDEFIADTHDALLTYLESLSIQTVLYAGNFVNDSVMFPALYPWLLTLHNGGYGVNRFNTYLLEDAITCHESPESLFEFKFKTVFLERAITYGFGMHKVSQAALLKDAAMRPVPDLAATQGDIPNAVAVTWSPGLAAQSYRILHGTTDVLADAIPIAQTMSCRFDDTNAVHGLVHYYWVVAETPWGPGMPGESATGFPGLAAPDTIAASTGEFRDHVRVAWPPVPGADTYVVFRSPSNDLPATAFGTTTNNNFDDISAPLGTHLSYWVVARNSLAASAPTGPALGWRRSPAATGTPGLDTFGDGKAALILYDESRGLWVLLGTNNSTLLLTWGGPGFLPVPGDYDADGRADLAVYHQQTGLWFIRSANGSILAWAESWGGPGMLPVPGDYNNDCRSDLAVYDQVGGRWYVASLPDPRGPTSETSLITWGLHWGGSSMIPVPGDYDGDGQSDYAVYWSNHGLWFILGATHRVLAWAIPLGGPEYIPVWGDYTGNGQTDLAVYHRTAGRWYIATLNAELVLWGEPWGGPGMIPVPGDYYGDGKSDLAVYDPASGRWYIRTVDGQIIRFSTAFGGGSFRPAFSPN